MVARAPELAPELARTLTAIRHEVLKHNTNLLSDVAHALEHGDGHAAAFAAQRLFGAPGGDGGVLSRFRGDIHQIDVLARRIGLRFHPPSDPVLGPLIRRMDALAALEGPMRHPRDRAALAARLRTLSSALNSDSYRALGQLIRRLGTLALKEALVRAVDARVRAEPQLAALDLPPLALDLPADPPMVRVLKGDLEDVLANLLRNAAVAVGAARAQGRAVGRLGLRVEEEDDAITGVESVLIRVLDDAPERLTASMVHGREAGRGLGLVVDLIHRHDGSLTVEERPDERAEGYTKAVVVRLQRAEADEARPGAGEGR
jgi:signal transduction histidine kinase